MALPPRSELCPESTRISALIVSDVRLYRESIASALGRHATIAVVGAVGSIGDAVDAVHALDPAVVVVDIAMRESLSGVRTLAAATTRGKVVIFAVDELASDIASCAEAGIAGYVPAEATVDDLAGMIEHVARDEARCSPRVAAALFRRVAALAADSRSAEPTLPLSHREREILTLIRRGLSNKEIAQQLTIEVTTVKNHVHSLLGKLRVSTRGAAAAVGRSPVLRSRLAGI